MALVASSRMFVARGTMLAVGLVLALFAAASAEHRALAESGTLAVDAREVGAGERLWIESIRLGETGEAVDLVLEPFDVFAPDAVVIVHGDGGGERSVPVPRAVYFRGAVDGAPGSGAFVSVHEDGFVRGLIRRGESSWAVVPHAQGVVAEPVVPSDDGGATCGNAELPLVPPGRSSRTAVPSLAVAAATSTIHRARIAVETDSEFLQVFGGNAAAATQYVGDVFAYMSLLYEEEVGTRIEVSSLSLWETSDDPWDQSSSTCQLMQFSGFWNENRVGVPRTIAHMLSGRNINGGAAWVAALCGDAFVFDHGGTCSGLPRIGEYGGGYGFTGGISGNFDAGSPEAVRDVVVTSHEVGHNFGSPHSHCYAGIAGNPSDVDHCYGSEAGCYAGVTTLPGLGSTSGGTEGGGNGTLMSYCHLRPGGYGNVSLTLGDGHPYGVAPERIPAVMRQHVEAVALENPSCLAAIAPTPTPTATPTPTTTPTLTPVPTPTPPPTATPTVAPLPTTTPIPTGAPVPTTTAVATTTPGATATPIPTGTPIPPTPTAPGGTGVSTIGLYEPLSSVFLLRNTNDAGVANLVFPYGPQGAGWTPVVGDWNGDGLDTVGLYDPATGIFFLRDANDAGYADLAFSYGPGGSGWIPVTGDWNGDGLDTVGLYDPVTGRFYLRYRNAAGPADRQFRYGPAGDRGWVPIAGDWDGDGIDTIGLFEPVTAVVYLRNRNRPGYADVAFRYGPPEASVSVLAGDWDSDGVDTIALFEPGSSGFYARNALAPGAADLSVLYGPPGRGWLPLAGDWNGR